MKKNGFKNKLIDIYYPYFSNVLLGYQCKHPSYVTRVYDTKEL